LLCGINGRRSGTTVIILARALVWATLFVGFGLVFLPARILGMTGIIPPVRLGLFQFGGIVVVSAGGVLVVSSIVAFAFVGKGTAAPFDPPRRLVTAGPFRYVRNPIYIGALFSLLGAATFYQSAGLVAYGVVLALGFHILVLIYEEPTLRRQFGTEYAAYCDRVARWLPKIRANDAG
jgi:protein-S-isoprenylcysteine O-methyltransferase Ste14